MARKKVNKVNFVFYRGKHGILQRKDGITGMEIKDNHETRLEKAATRGGFIRKGHEFPGDWIKIEFITWGLL